MSSNERLRTAPPLKRRQRLSTRLARRALPAIESGHIRLILPSDERIDCAGRLPGPSATVVVHRWRAMARLLFEGDLGFAQAYIDGDWSSPDLATLLEVAARNIDAVNHRIGLLPARLLNRLRHLLRANSLAGSRKNIAYHYDLGNAFYQCWLDASMTYSSARYAHPGQTLEDAQQSKLAAIIERLTLGGGERVLEIGCGWGALALELARRGCEVTGITLSREQLAFARQRVQQARLEARVDLEWTDYRNIGGSYDRVVSIEMLEAVGEAYWPRYFGTLHDRLKKGGTALVQAITIDDERFESYRREPDFIQRHVFPGGMLPTRDIIRAEAVAAGLTPVSTEHFGADYATTLHEWRRRFVAAWPRIRDLGFPEHFRRLWEYYLCYCEAGFRTGTIDVGFYVFTRS